MKAYPEYKESGIEWIKKIPKNWRISKFSFHFKTGMGETILSNNLIDNGSYPVFSATEKDTIFGYINDPKIILDFGDLIIPARGVSIGHVKFVQDKCTCTQTTIYAKNISKDNLHPRFVYYFLIGNREILFFYDRTAIPQITCEQVNANRIAVPPLPEQQAIADFLDRKTAQIDTLIEKKQRQIDLLHEQRTALINHAVTKGLNPDVRMKDSGVEWLGEIPSHWRMTNVRHENMAGRLEHQDGNHGEIHPKAEDYVDAGIPFVMANNVKNGELDIVNDCKYISKEQADNLRVGFATTEDVLLTHKGTIGRVAIVGIIPTEYIMLTPQVTYYRCKEGIYNKYLKWLFESHCFQTQLGIISSKGTTRDYIGIVAQNELILHFPPIREQEDIVEWLENKITPINDTVKRLDKLLVFLKEYRTALISEAVTGKIDVRGS